MSKQKILLIKTGGTIAQKPGEGGYLEPCNEDYLHKIEGLQDLADITPMDLGVIDSTNMETNYAFTLTQENPSQEELKRDRAAVAREIYKNALKYDGFVVIHGTDTMSETSAALTYMLPGFRKPIILTGSQRSIWVPASDAQNNVYTAVQAAKMDLGEVCIAFGNFLVRGSKAVKVDEEGYDAFDSPGTEALGKKTSLSEGIRLRDRRIRSAPFDPHIFTDFDTNVFNYAHISGATVDKALMKLAEDEDIDGFLMSGFGAGNIPNRLLGFIGKAREYGKPVFVYTKCDLGAADMGIYSVGEAPLRAGAKPAGDMTLEALGQKFMYALGRAHSEEHTGNDRLEFVDYIIRTPYNGDITVTQRRK